MKLVRQLLLYVIAIFAALVSIPSRADLVGLVLNVPSGPPGATLSFEGTLTNNTSSTVFLVMPSLLQTGGLTPDFSAFNTTSPLQLAPSETTGPIVLFTAVIDPATPVGTQIDALLSFTGGTDLADTGIAAQEFFVVNVTAPVGTPEPLSVSMLTFGFAACLGIRRRSSLFQGNPIR